MKPPASLHRAQPIRLGEGLELAQGRVLNLADALTCDVERAADLFERARVLGQSPNSNR